MLVADPDLIARWADAWAISRGAAMPVARHGGLYIHVDQPDQIGRYIFAQLDADAIRPLAASIDRSLLYLKICAPAASPSRTSVSSCRLAESSTNATSRRQVRQTIPPDTAGPWPGAH